MRSMYLTLEQSVYVTRVVQGALFAFPREAQSVKLVRPE
jgi:hypothetical protein